MRQYELTYLVSDKVSDTEMNAATGKINGMIADHGGKVLSEEGWGRRKLAYPIQKQEFASYVTLHVELDPSELLQINRELSLSKNILRYLIVVKDEGKQAITLTKEEIVATDAIEEVVGGERSFEAIEGETEESYDLMATRSEDAEETKIEAAPAEAEVAEETEEAPEAEAKEEDKEEKPKKAAAKKTPTEKTEKVAEEPKTAEAVEAPAEEKPKKKPAKKATAKPETKEKADEEADRLAKLNEEIKGILGDDL